MPSFSSIDTMRFTQWRVLRQFVLEERRDAGAREAMILAEQKRIGKVRILYGRDEETGEVNQVRQGIVIDGAPDCALAKLVQAYVALGGNPFDISLFLYSNDDESPGKGFAYPKGMSYSMQGQERDSDSNIEKYKPSRIGGTRETQSEIIAANMTLLRRWTTKEMYYKRIRLEERIIKLSDLYEQLEQERVMLVGAVQGQGMRAIYDTDKYQDSHTVPVLVYTIDSIWNQPDEDGRVPVTNPEGETLGQFPMLMDDGPGDDNNAL